MQLVPGTILAPMVIAFIIAFPTATEVPQQYDIRNGDLITTNGSFRTLIRSVLTRYYMLFGVVIVPFQVGMDILMNHATELAHGVKIYDYMLYAKWRWRNRLTRWLFDDPRFDQSIGEQVQGVNHLCFSPQFYFIVAYYTWGMIMTLLGITTLLRKQANPFEDPAFVYYIAQQYIANRILDSTIRWMTFHLLWKPRDNASAKAFAASIKLGLKQKEMQTRTSEFRENFFHRHKEWILSNVGLIFTPRHSRQRYRAQLSGMYQNLLSLQSPFEYRMPDEDLLAGRIQPGLPGDEAGDILPIDDGEESDYELLGDALVTAGKRLTEDEERRAQRLEDEAVNEVRLKLPQGVTTLGWAALESWYTVARQRIKGGVSSQRLGLPSASRSKYQPGGSQTMPPAIIAENDEIAELDPYPDWLTANITLASKEMLLHWAKEARARLKKRHRKS
ncbi:hypothetical protein FOZ62_029418 [Perkinsus olseni]|uniref:Uncharacterized protein n=1 Tax=Perkinsus olseni TaxID=32597 RepID=A0A7J6TB74_PEROL|nr:hypothetical protein FOZ62_029418 [Perkinsus olseni]